MPSLSELILKNLQSHKLSVFDFHPNFNAIIGSSNSGKSTAVRGLDFLFTGNWSKSFVRDGEKDAEILARIESGAIIERTKGSVNKVSKTDSTGKREDYSGFGESLPSDVVDALGTRPFQIDKDKELTANLARQHDPPFLLKEVGSFCAKVLGRLSGLHLVDIALRSLNLESRTASSRLVLERTRIANAKIALEKYSTMEDDRIRLKTMKAEMVHQQEIRQICERISILQRNVAIFNQDVGSNKEKKERLKAIDIDFIRQDFVKKLMEAGVCPTCGTGFTEESAKTCLGGGYV